MKNTERIFSNIFRIQRSAQRFLIRLNCIAMIILIIRFQLLWSQTDLSPFLSPLRVVPQQSFGVGEELVFSVGWGLVNAGTAVMSITDLLQYQGRPCYRILATAQSNKFFDSFYKVRDSTESVVDSIGIFPWRFSKNLNEGRYHSKRWAQFDQEQGHVITAETTYAVPSFVQDILSTFFYVRTHSIVPQSTFDIENFSDNRHYPLRVLVKDRETIKVPAGTFNCIELEPILRGEGLFKAKGRLHVWVTDDEKKIPVLMKSKILLGSISAKLVAYKPDARSLPIGESPQEP